MLDQPSGTDERKAAQADGERDLNNQPVSPPDPLCIYGCLLCLLQFGPHITKGILLQHSGANFNIKVLATQLQARLEVQDAPDSRMEVDQ